MSKLDECFGLNVLEHLKETARKRANADEHGVQSWSDAQIRRYLKGGKHGETRDTMVWGAVQTEAARRGMVITPAPEQYSFH